MKRNSTFAKEEEGGVWRLDERRDGDDVELTCWFVYFRLLLSDASLKA